MNKNLSRVYPPNLRKIIMENEQQLTILNDVALAIYETIKYIGHYIAYYGSALLPVMVCAVLFLVIPQSIAHNEVLSYAKMFWFVSGLYVLANALGMVHGSPWHHDKRNSAITWDRSKTLILVYVSRGQNNIALTRAIAASRLALDEVGVNYIIEAVTDMPVSAGADNYIVVPPDYRTRKGAKYKARALHYATRNRKAGKHTWLVHMDEESVITAEALRGIAKFIGNGSILRIGQGEIQYNAHQYSRHGIITAVDAVRTGDDLGRFRLQYALFKKPLFGMHGSYFVVNSLLERKVGFDLGSNGSITEDAYFALKCADRGIKFNWVDGAIREQSPFSISDLLKQRRRWFCGLRMLVRDKEVSFKQRFVLGLTLALARIAWIGFFVTIWNVVVGGSSLPFVLQYIAALMTGSIISVYLVGAYRNAVGSDLPAWRKLAVWVSVGLLVPVSCLVESAAVIYSIVRPIKTFEVVAKN